MKHKLDFGESKHYAIPNDSILKIRESLRSSSMARMEMMRHIQNLAKEEIDSHATGWNLVSKIVGFDSIKSLAEEGYELSINWDSTEDKVITLRRKRNDE